MHRIALIALLVCALTAEALPDSHYIQGVPYHRQINAWDCGGASLAMVFGYWLPHADITQKLIMDVARTDPIEGTLSYDIVRVGHYSLLSNAASDRFPNDTTVHGFLKQHHPVGFGAFGRDDSESWLEGLLEAVASDIPVIVLQHFSHRYPGGHYRVVVGFDYVNQTITTHDPWGRQGQPHIFTVSFTEFNWLWNYTESGSPRKRPYFAVAITPWTVDVDVDSNSSESVAIVTANITYTCPSAWISAPRPQPVAEPVTVYLDVEYAAETNGGVDISERTPPPIPSSVFVMTNVTPMSIGLGALAAGQSAAAKWTLSKEVARLLQVEAVRVRVRAHGIVATRTFFAPCCHAPESNVLVDDEEAWKPHGRMLEFPSYEYMDVIGGASKWATVQLL